MGYVLENNYLTVRALSPSLSSEIELATIRTTPSGAIVTLGVPKSIFDTAAGNNVLNDFAQAVEDLLAGALASGAVGVQGIDEQGLVYDAVAFTVVYEPATPRLGTISTVVEIPAGVITADPSFANFLTGGSATERLAAAYANLKALAGE